MKCLGRSKPIQLWSLRTKPSAVMRLNWPRTQPGSGVATMAGDQCSKNEQACDCRHSEVQDFLASLLGGLYRCVCSAAAWLGRQRGLGQHYCYSILGALVCPLFPL